MSVIMTTTTSTVHMATVLNISIVGLLGLRESEPVKELVHLEHCALCITNMEYQQDNMLK